MTIQQHELGPILYTQGKNHICEGGVCDNKKSILWDEVEALFLFAWESTANDIAKISEGLMVDVVATTGAKIRLTEGGWGGIDDKDKSDFWNLYQLMVASVIDRQWSKLVEDIGQGKKVSFRDFDITSSAIHQKKLFGGYNIMGLDRVTACYFANGDLAIDFVNDKGSVKRKRLSTVGRIPNVHLAQAFLSSVARKNTGQ